MCFRPAGLAPFPLKCPECGTFNKPGNMSCQKCGIDLTDAWNAAVEEKTGKPNVAPATSAPAAPSAPAPAAPAPAAPKGAPKPPIAPPR